MAWFWLLCGGHRPGQSESVAPAIRIPANHRPHSHFATSVSAEEIRVAGVSTYQQRIDRAGSSIGNRPLDHFDGLMRTKCWVESKRDLACPMMEGDERVSPARQAIHNRRAIHVPQCRAAKAECPRMARIAANRKPLASFAGKQCKRKLRTADASSLPERLP